jgi:hypothetical protein
MWYDARRTIKLVEGNTMSKSLITPPAGPATAPSNVADWGNADGHWSSARLAAVVEAAYLLDAVRR